MENLLVSESRIWMLLLCGSDLDLLNQNPDPQEFKRHKIKHHHGSLTPLKDFRCDYCLKIHCWLRQGCS